MALDAPGRRQHVDSNVEAPTVAQVIVKNLDDDVVASLKRRADRHGHSLEQELREILTRAARPDRAALLAEADGIRAMTPGVLSDSTELIHEDRDNR